MFACALASDDLVQIQLALNGFKHLSTESDLFSESAFAQDIAQNASLHSAFADLSHKARSMPYEALQQAICGVLPRFNSSSLSLPIIWNALSKVWHAQVDKFLIPSAATATNLVAPVPSIPLEWPYLARYICIIGGIATGTHTLDSSSGASASSIVSDVTGIKRFLSRAVDILALPPTDVILPYQTSLVAVLSTDVHASNLPALFDILLSRYANLTVEPKAKTVALPVNKTRFVKTTLASLCKLIHRLAATDSMSVMSSLSVSPILTSACSYLNQLTKIEEMESLARAWFCELVDLVICYRQYLNVSGEMSVRNQLLYVLIDWAHLSQEDFQHLHVQYVFHSSVAAVKAVSALLLELPLIPPRDALDLVSYTVLLFSV